MCMEGEGDERLCARVCIETGRCHAAVDADELAVVQGKVERMSSSLSWMVMPVSRERIAAVNECGEIGVKSRMER